MDKRRLRRAFIIAFIIWFFIFVFGATVYRLNSQPRLSDYNEQVSLGDYWCFNQENAGQIRCEFPQAFLESSIGSVALAFFSFFSPFILIGVLFTPSFLPSHEDELRMAFILFLASPYLQVLLYSCLIYVASSFYKKKKR